MANFSISYIYQIKDKMSPTLTKINEKIKRQTQELQKNQSAWAKITAGARKYGGSVTKATHRLDAFNNKILESTGSIIALGASIASIAFPVKKAMEFQSAMTDLAKVSTLKRGTEEFKQMEAVIKTMSEQMGISTSEIAKMMESGARLGINSSKELQDFAKLSAKVVVALGMSAEEAGDKIGSLRGKFNISTSETAVMLDAVNTLEADTSTSASRILDTLERTSSQFATLGIAPEVAASLSAVANEVSVSSETAATGLKIMFTRMQTNSKFAAKMVTDPMGTIREHMQELADMPAAKRTAVIFKEFGAEALPIVQGLIKDLGEYDRVVGITADRTKFVGSMTEEYNAKQKDLAQQLARAKVGLENIAMEIGTALIPIVGQFASMIAKSATEIRLFIHDNHALVIVLATLVTGFVSAIAMAKLWQLTLVAGQGALLVINPAMKLFTLGVSAARSAMLMFNIAMATNPIGMLIAGVALLGTALAGIIIYWDDITAAINNAIDSGLQFISSIFGGNESEGSSNVQPKLSGADAKGANKVDGNIEVSVAGTNAQVTGANVSGKNLAGTGIVRFSDYMNM